MKGKPIRYKNKILVALVALFTMLMCTSIGFAAWVTSGTGASTNTNGNIAADDYIETTGGDAYCISDLEITPFGYSQGYGFVNPTTGTYVNTATLAGTFTFDVSEARDSINSLGGSKQFSLKIELTTTAPSSIAYGSFSFTGFTNSPVSKATTATSATFNITLTNAEYALDEISCGFSITMTYSGSLSSFPSLSSATYSIAITPDEVIS